MCKLTKNFIGSTSTTSSHLGSIIIANIDLVPDWEHVELAKALPSHKCAGSSLSSQQSAVAEEDLRMREAAGWAFPSPSWLPSCRHISSLTPHLAKSSLFVKVSMFSSSKRHNRHQSCWSTADVLIPMSQEFVISSRQFIHEDSNDLSWQYFFKEIPCDEKIVILKIPLILQVCTRVFFTPITFLNIIRKNRNCKYWSLEIDHLECSLLT